MIEKIVEGPNLIIPVGTRVKLRDEQYRRLKLKVKVCEEPNEFISEQPLNFLHGEVFEMEVTEPEEFVSMGSLVENETEVSTAEEYEPEQ